MKLKTILFPTDFSESSDAALSFASSLAAESGAKLQIVHVGNDTPTYLAGYYGSDLIPDTAKQVAEENQRLLTEIKPTVSGVQYEHQYLTGLPETEILKFADQERIDLIVIGSHGRTGITRMLLGSIAEAIVRGARCPVLTVKQPVEKACEEIVETEMNPQAKAATETA